MFLFSASMTLNEKGRVNGVTLEPTEDIDPTLLSTLTHTVVAVGNLVKFSINKVSPGIEVKGVDDAQWREIK